MRIISADQRLAEQRGVKALIVGPTGVGKTSLLRTLLSTTTLFVDIEAGDLSVQDVPVDTIRVDSWSAARDLACRIGGPNPSFPPTACYSQAHYEKIGGALANVDKYDTVFVELDHGRQPLVVPPRRAAARSIFRTQREKGCARRLRTTRARDDCVAAPIATRAQNERHLRRHPGKGD